MARSKIKLKPRRVGAVLPSPILMRMTGRAEALKQAFARELTKEERMKLQMRPWVALQVLSSRTATIVDCCTLHTRVLVGEKIAEKLYSREVIQAFHEARVLCEQIRKRAEITSDAPYYIDVAEEATLTSVLEAIDGIEAEVSREDLYDGFIAATKLVNEGRLYVT